MNVPNIDYNVLLKYSGKGWVEFDALPPQAQQAVKQYMEIDGDARAEWATYKLSEESIEGLKQQIGGDGFADDFDGYHKWYMKNLMPRDWRAKYNQLWPVILGREEGSEMIDDGWHRFHAYVEKGVKVVPTIEVKNKRGTESFSIGEEA